MRTRQGRVGLTYHRANTTIGLVSDGAEVCEALSRSSIEFMHGINHRDDVLDWRVGL